MTSRSAIPSLLALVLLASPLMFAPSAHAAGDSWWLKGASFVPSASDTFASDSFKQSARNFQAAGGTYVNFVVPLYQSNVGSTDIGAGYNTPTDSALAAGISYVHSLGMHAQVSIYLESYDGQWRANINPGDRTTWYKNYGAELVHYGQLAQGNGVELYMLGAELIDMASASQNGDNTERWDTMIASVRSVYHGALTYSANRGQQGWESELPNVGFWDKLDYVGVSAYYELSGDGSVASMASDWQNVNNYDITPIAQKTGKPVIFTEVGYRSVGNAHSQPWDSWDGGNYDPQEQVNDYTALFSYWSGVSFVQGVDLWSWSPDPNYGGSGNIDYTPQGKPATSVMQQWWSGSATPQPQPTQPTTPTTTPSGATSGSAAFSTSGSASPTAPTTGQGTSISATITDTSGSITNALIDLEIYNASAAKVFQQFFPNQSFTSGQSQQYSANWPAGGSGAYTVKLGVFSNDWTKNFAWNNSAATITVGGSASTTTAAVMDVWWPTDGSHVSGVQPFKAMLEGVDVSQYQMYWQVDGGALVQMSNSTESYPHKESLVDLSSWKWDGTNPYTITFVAKDTSGATITQKSVHIFIP